MNYHHQYEHHHSQPQLELNNHGYVSPYHETNEHNSKTNHNKNDDPFAIFDSSWNAQDHPQGFHSKPESSWGQEQHYQGNQEDLIETNKPVNPTQAMTPTSINKGMFLGLTSQTSTGTKSIDSRGKSNYVDLKSKQQNHSLNDPARVNVLQPSLSPNKNADAHDDPFASCDAGDPGGQTGYSYSSFRDTIKEQNNSHFSSNTAVNPYSTNTFDTNQNPVISQDTKMIPNVMNPINQNTETTSPYISNHNMDNHSNDDINSGNAKEGEIDELECEDKEFRQAQEAALYAEEMIKKEFEEKNKASLELNLLPKAQNFWNDKFARQQEPNSGTSPFSARSAASMTAMATAREEENEKTASSFQNNQYGESSGDSPCSDTPSWISPATEKQPNNAKSDYGLEPEKKSIFGFGFGSSNTQGEEEKDHRTPKPSKGAAVLGASVIGGVAGLMTIGPLVGVVAAGGAAAAAANRDNSSVGTVLHAGGGLVAQAGSAAKRVEDEHGILRKTATGLGKGIGWIAGKINQNQQQ